MTEEVALCFFHQAHDVWSTSLLECVIVGLLVTGPGRVVMLVPFFKLESVPNLEL